MSEIKVCGGQGRANLWSKAQHCGPCVQVAYHLAFSSLNTELYIRNDDIIDLKVFDNFNYQMSFKWNVVEILN